MATTPYPFVSGAVLTASQLNSTFNVPVSTKTANYTLVAADGGTRVVMNSAGSTTITVNTGIFSAGDSVWIHNIGAGTCTITAGTATVTTSGSLALAQWGGGSLYFTSASAAIFFPGGGGAIGLPVIEEFYTAGSGTWTVPAGITYAVVYMGGGGGGVNTGGAGGNGGNTTFAFASGTVTAYGGKGHSDGTGTSDQTYAASWSGQRATAGGFAVGSGTTGGAAWATDGQEIVYGGAVTPGASISYTVGAGGTGTSGSYVGAPGYILIEYGSTYNNRRISTFTTSGTFTPPATTTVVKATICGGGGSSTTDNNAKATDGGSSSVAFSSGTVTAVGGKGGSTYRAGFSTVEGAAAADKSGKGARARSRDSGNGGRSLVVGGDGQIRVVRRTVTPSSGITVTIGAGGTYGYAGGDGYVIFDYYV